MLCKRPGVRSPVHFIFHSVFSFYVHLCVEVAERLHQVGHFIWDWHGLQNLTKDKSNLLLLYTIHFTYISQIGKVDHLQILSVHSASDETSGEYELICQWSMFSNCLLFGFYSTFASHWADLPAGCAQHNYSWLAPLSYFLNSSRHPWQQKSHGSSQYWTLKLCSYKVFSCRIINWE